jgi:hypothetical protein
MNLEEQIAAMEVMNAKERKADGIDAWASADRRSACK